MIINEFNRTVNYVDIFFAENIKWEVVAEPAEACGAMKTTDAEQCKAIDEAMVAKLKA